MKTLLTSFFFVFCFFSLMAQQTDSLKQEIINQPPSSFEFLMKGRYYLADRLEAGDLQKVKDIKDELLREVDNEIDKAFYTYEYPLILFWTEEYKDLISYVQSFLMVDNKLPYNRTIRHDPYFMNIFQYNDQLYTKLIHKSAESHTTLVHFLKQSDLDDLEKDFLELYLNWVIFSPNSPRESMYAEAVEEINMQADAFLDKYPDSIYDKYVRQRIRFVLALSNWGGGYSIEAGYLAMQNSMAKQFKDGFIMHLALTGSYKKTYLQLGFNLGTSTTLVDFPFQDITWNKGSHVVIVGADVSLGYEIFNKNRWSLTPFAGIGVLNFSAGAKEIQEEKKLEDLSYSAPNYSAGVNISYVVSGDKHPAFGYNESKGLINLRYTYNIPKFNKDKVMNGAMHWITLGWGGHGRPQVRRY